MPIAIGSKFIILGGAAAARDAGAPRALHRYIEVGMYVVLPPARTPRCRAACEFPASFFSLDTVVLVSIVYMEK